MSVIWEVTQALRRGKPVPMLTEGFVAGIEVPAGRRDVLVFDRPDDMPTVGRAISSNILSTASNGTDPSARCVRATSKRCVGSPRR
jgi:hypothetical protein